MRFLDENGRVIDNLVVEREEQLQAQTYIRPDSVVLELGARYGSVSCIINRKLAIKSNQVSVEPDERVQEALELNMRENGCEFHIVKGVISKTPVILTKIDSHRGYGTTSIKANTSSIVSYRLDDIQEMYGLKFNTLVADCEGFLEQFFDENPGFYAQLDLVMLEKDYPDKCNYDKIKTELQRYGLVQIETGFHEVWWRPSVLPRPLAKNTRIIHMSSARERVELLKSIINLTGATVFEAIVTPHDGHIGCTRSHRTIYKQIPAGEDLLIFEDDCEIIDPSFTEYVEQNKASYDIIYIGVNEIFTTRDKYWTPRGSYGTHAMWISAKAINHFLTTQTFIKEIDHLWSHIEDKHKLRVLRPTPVDRFVRKGSVF